MKVINPVGRTVNTGAEAHFSIEPRACMCGIGSTEFSVVRGPEDHCFHCGCSCGRTSGNDGTAFYTIRSSN